MEAKSRRKPYTDSVISMSYIYIIIIIIFLALTVLHNLIRPKRIRNERHARLNFELTLRQTDRQTDVCVGVMESEIFMRAGCHFGVAAVISASALPTTC